MSQLFEITHDAGTLAEYDSTATDGGDLSAHAGAALAGSSAGLRVLIDDTNELYGQKDHTAEGELRCRLYIDPNGLSIPSGALRWAWWKNVAGSTRYCLYLSKSGANYVVTLYATEDDDSWVNAASGTISDAEHYIEVYYKCATGAGQNNGIAQLWIDGTSRGSSTSLDNDAYSDDVDMLRVGASDVSGGISGTFYIDEIIARDDSTEIGPVPSGVPAHMLHYSALRR